MITENLKWTKKRPKKLGWYWCRKNGGEACMALYRKESEGRLQLSFIAAPGCYAAEPRRGEGWEFAGPIPEPIND